MGAAALASAMMAAAATAEAGQTAQPEKTPVGTAPAAPAEAPGILVPAKTVVEIAVSEPLSSKTSNIGDTFAITLTEPLVIDGRSVLPAGLSGRGEVTHAAKSGWGGKAGELIINARFLECGAVRIPLGYFHHGRTGKDNFGGAFVASQFVPLGQFMVSGGDAAIPAGARGTAKVKGDFLLPANAVAGCAQAAK